MSFGSSQFGAFQFGGGGSPVIPLAIGGSASIEFAAVATLEIEQGDGYTGGSATISIVATAVVVKQVNIEPLPASISLLASLRLSRRGTGTRPWVRGKIVSRSYSAAA